MGAVTTAPYYLPVFICIPSFPPTSSAGSHMAYFNVAFAHSGWKTSDAEKITIPTYISKDDIKWCFSFNMVDVNLFQHM